jgi:subtilisin-like proprotein convertase family protein
MFYGENSNGNWTIKIVDKKSGTTGSIGSWKLTVFGR